MSENPGSEVQSVEERARAVVESIRPFIQADGGDIEFLGIEKSTVKVRLQGACSGCPHAAYTLAMGVERHLRERVPEVTAVVNVP